MIILGAGMAGCLAGIVNSNAIILEKSESPPNNHNAVLRFRDDGVSKVTGIPFRKVSVQKSIWYEGQHRPLDPRLANMYSQKVLGVIIPRSINNLDTVTRYIAPPDFHQLLIGQCADRIQYGESVIEITNSLIGCKVSSPIPRKNHPVISTMPIGVLARVIGLPISTPSFNFRRIFTTRIKISNCDTFQTIYYPDESDTKVYRATLTGSDLIIESMGEITTTDIGMVIQTFGICGTHRFEIINDNQEQRYGKIQEIDENVRRNFILQATLRFNVYSLGRFATWRNILLDDVLSDIYVINKLVHADIYSQHIIGAQNES